ncbi:MAG: hypothetical protein HZA89_00665 [Verrucomicrobia bacterium]|nr:hypothetical protein [Verrucomicrobiota bacterium]
MDWQQAVSLGIVALTVSVFVWRRLRRRRFSFERDTHCGCTSGQSAASQPSIVYHRQRGGPQEILVRHK